MAFSTLSLGMFAARAFWMTRRSAGLDSGFGPPFLTAIVISFPIREKSLDMRSQRANIVALRVSKMRPMGSRGESGLARAGAPAAGTRRGRVGAEQHSRRAARVQCRASRRAAPRVLPIDPAAVYNPGIPEPSGGRDAISPKQHPAA